MEITTLYIKERKEFGRPCSHLDSTEPATCGAFESDATGREAFIERNPVVLEVQAIPDRSENFVNTDTVAHVSQGMCHTEGGWPKDVDHTEKEQVVRYRKKVEKDEEYIKQVKTMCDEIESSLMQNLAIDIYEGYFDGESPDAHACGEEAPPSAKTLAAFKDPSEVKRTACRISWSPDGGKKIGVAFSIMQFQDWRIDKAPRASYIWDVTNPNAPEMALDPVSPLCCLEYNVKDQYLLVGGSYNGLLSYWDTRKGSQPADTSVIEHSHRDPVFDVCWLAGKQATECVSTSTDGQVLWWDTRKLAEPLEKMMVEDRTQEGRAIGGVKLEYTTAGGKFLVATEEGSIFACNRKAKNPADRVGQCYEAHAGPVYKVTRNPYFPKYFLSIGDWTWRLWNEEVRSPIISSRYHMSYMLDACWSPTRPGLFFASKMDGTLDVWDIFSKQNEPTLSLQVDTDGLYSVSMQEQGQRLCAGSVDGSVYMLEFSEGLTAMQRNEKLAVSQMFERESKREKNLEAVAKARKVAEKNAAAQKAPEAEAVKDTWVERQKEVEEAFWAAVGDDPTRA